MSIEVQPTVTVTDRTPTGDSRAVYEHLISLQDQMFNALKYSKDGDRFVALKDAYDKTAEGAPEVMSYLTKVSTLEADSNPRRAASAAKALPSYFDKRAAVAGLNTKIYDDPTYNTYWTTRWNAPQDTANRVSKLKSGQLDVTSDEGKLAAVESEQLDFMRHEYLKKNGVDNTSGVGVQFAQVKGIVDAHSVSDPSGGKISTSRRMGDAYTLVRQSDGIADPSTVLGLQTTLTGVISRSFGGGDKNTVGEGAVKTDVPWDSVQTAATQAVSRMLQPGMAAGALSAFSNVVTDMFDDKTTLNVKKPEDVFGAILRVSAAAAAWDENTFEQEANQAGLDDYAKQEARKALTYLSVVESGGVTVNAGKVQQAKETLKTAGLDSLYQTGGLADSVRESIPVSGVSGGMAKDFTRLTGEPVTPKVVSGLGEAKSYKMKAENSIGVAKRLFQEANIDDNTRVALGQLATLAGDGIKTPEDAQATAAWFRTNAGIQKAAEGNPSLKTGIDSVVASLDAFALKKEDLYKRNSIGLATEAARTSGLSTDVTVPGALKATAKANDEIFDHMFRGGMVASLRAIGSALKGAVTGDGWSKGWDASARAMVEDRVFNSTAPVEALGGLSLKQWSQAMTQENRDKVVDVYADKLKLSAVHGFAVEVPAMLAVGELATTEAMLGPALGVVSSGITRGTSAVGGFIERTLAKKAGRQLAEKATTETGKKFVGGLTREAFETQVKSKIEAEYAGFLSKFANNPGRLDPIMKKVIATKVRNQLEKEYTQKGLITAGVSGAAQGLSWLSGAEGTSFNRPSGLSAIIIDTTDRLMKGDDSLSYDAQAGVFRSSGAFNAAKMRVLDSGQVPEIMVDGKPYDIKTAFVPAVLAALTANQPLNGAQKDKITSAMNATIEAVRFGDEANKRVDSLSRDHAVSASSVELVLAGKSAAVAAVGAGTDLRSVYEKKIRQYSGNQSVAAQNNTRYYLKALQDLDEADNKRRMQQQLIDAGKERWKAAADLSREKVAAGTDLGKGRLAVQQGQLAVRQGELTLKQQSSGFAPAAPEPAPPVQ